MPPLSGVLPPLITPLLDCDTLDVAHLEKLVEHQLTGGVHGFFLLGTTGEGPSLSHRLKHELVHEVCRLAQGRVPILVNISDTSMTESIALARHSAESGANAVVVTSPYYFPLDQENLWLYLKQLIGRLPLPVYLYNMPSHVKVNIGTEVIERALQEPAILGIKDSSGDMSYFHTLVKLAKQRGDWSVMVGPEELFAEVLSCGGHGGVLGGANLYPRLLVQLFQVARAKDHDQLSRIQEKLLWLNRHIFKVVASSNGWLVGLKTALAIEGFCLEQFAEPIHPMNDEQRTQLQHFLTELRRESEF